MAANLRVGDGNTKRVNLLARFAKGRRRCGASSAIHLRRPARSGRPKAGNEERSGAEGSLWAGHLGSLCWKDGGHSLPGEAASRRGASDSFCRNLKEVSEKRAEVQISLAFAEDFIEAPRPTERG